VLAARLSDSGRDDDLAGLVLSGDASPAVRMAVASAMFDHGINPFTEVTAALVNDLAERTEPFRWARRPNEQDLDVREVVWTLVHALRHKLLEEAVALDILDLHLPRYLPDSAGGRLYGLSVTNLLLAHALRARLLGASLAIDEVASPPLLELMGRENVDDHNARDFKANIPGLLPWAECWLAVLLADTPDEVVDDVAALVGTDLKPVISHNGTPFVLVNGIAEIATRVLSLVLREDLISVVAAGTSRRTLRCRGPPSRSRA